MGARNGLRSSEVQLLQEWLSTYVARNTASTSHTRVQPSSSSSSTDSYMNSRLDQLLLLQRPTTSRPLNLTTPWVPTPQASRPMMSKILSLLKALATLSSAQKIPCALDSFLRPSLTRVVRTFGYDSFILCTQRCSSSSHRSTTSNCIARDTWSG